MLQLQEILEELVQIEKYSNTQWREMTETLNVLDHETEIIPLSGPQLLKVASYRRKMRIERRRNKNNWVCSKAFNDSFQTIKILNSVGNARLNLGRQQRAGEDLIEDRGLIASILSTKIKTDKQVDVIYTDAEEEAAITEEEDVT